MKIRVVKGVTMSLLAVMLVVLALSALMYLGRIDDIIPPSQKEEAPEDILTPIPVDEFGGITTETDLLSSAVSGDIERTTLASNKVKIEIESIGEEAYSEWLTDDKTLLYADYSFITVDIDLEIDNLDDIIDLYLIFRNSVAGNIGTPKGYGKKLFITPNNDSYNVSILNNYEEQIVANLNENTVYHLTFVYMLSDNLEECKANIYLDGNYIGSFERFVSSVPYFIDNFRLHQRAINNTSEPDILYLSNYEVNVFEKGYEGAINYLFNSPEYTLQECSDSVLFVPEVEAE